MSTGSLLPVTAAAMIISGAIGGLLASEVGLWTLALVVPNGALVGAGACVASAMIDDWRRR